jgi:hypothetical protein
MIVKHSSKELSNAIAQIKNVLLTIMMHGKEEYTRFKVPDINFDMLPE